MQLSSPSVFLAWCLVRSTAIRDVSVQRTSADREIHNSTVLAATGAGLPEFLDAVDVVSGFTELNESTKAGLQTSSEAPHGHEDISSSVDVIRTTSVTADARDHSSFVFLEAVQPEEEDFGSTTWFEEKGQKVKIPIGTRFINSIGQEDSLQATEEDFGSTTRFEVKGPKVKMTRFINSIGQEDSLQGEAKPVEAVQTPQRNFRRIQSFPYVMNEDKYNGVLGYVGAAVIGRPDEVASDIPTTGFCTGPIWYHYEKIEELGKGNFGSVFRARARPLPSEEENLGEVAVKEVLAKKFNIREIKPALYFLPFNSGLYEGFYNGDAAGGKFFLVMPLYGGGDLDKVCSSVKYGPKEIRLIAAQIALGLYKLHRQGFIHRDIKPENIMTEQTEMGLTVRIADYGLCAGGCNAQKKVKAKGVIGSPLYMGRAQWENKPAGPEVDWHAYAGTLYQLVVRNLRYHPLIKKGGKSSFKEAFHDVMEGEVDVSRVKDERLQGLLRDLLTKDNNTLYNPEALYAEDPKHHPVLGHPYFWAYPEPLPFGWREKIGDPKKGEGMLYERLGDPPSLEVFKQLSNPPEETQSLAILVSMKRAPEDLLQWDLCGLYLLRSDVKGQKPVYVKDNQIVDVGGEIHEAAIYYWEGELEGWWIGTLGGHHAWARNDEKSATPPTNNWKVNWENRPHAEHSGWQLEVSLLLKYTMLLWPPSLDQEPAEDLKVEGGRDFIQGYYRLLKFEHDGKPTYWKELVEVEHPRPNNNSVKIMMSFKIFFINGYGWCIGPTMPVQWCWGHHPGDEKEYIPPKTGWLAIEPGSNEPGCVGIDSCLVISDPNPHLHLTSRQGWFWFDLCRKYNHYLDNCFFDNRQSVEPVPHCRHNKTTN